MITKPFKTYSTVRSLDLQYSHIPKPANHSHSVGDKMFMVNGNLIDDDFLMIAPKNEWRCDSPGHFHIQCCPLSFLSPISSLSYQLTGSIIQLWHFIHSKNDVYLNFTKLTEYRMSLPGWLLMSLYWL